MAQEKGTIGKQAMAQERARLANKSYSSRKGNDWQTSHMAQERARLANKSYSSRKGTIGKQVIWLKKGHGWQTSHMAQESPSFRGVKY